MAIPGPSRYQKQATARRKTSDITRLVDQYQRNVEAMTQQYETAFSAYQQQTAAQLAPYEQAVQQYKTELLPTYEQQAEDYRQKSQQYEESLRAYEQYMNSFYIAPGTNKPESFVKYGDSFYWSGDITQGFNLKAIGQLPSLSGGEFQFVGTGQQQHSYATQQYERVPKQVWQTESYTAYEVQLKPVQKYEYTYVPPPFGSMPGTPGSYQYKLVTKNEFVSTPVTKTRQVMRTVWQDELVTRPVTETIQTGYLKTQTDGGFTNLTPEQFSVRSQPAAFTEKLPTAPTAPTPPKLDEFDASQFEARRVQLESELQRELGERRGARRRAVSRGGARPLLQGT